MYMKPAYQDPVFLSLLFSLLFFVGLYFCLNYPHYPLRVVSFVDNFIMKARA